MNDGEISIWGKQLPTAMPSTARGRGSITSYVDCLIIVSAAQRDLTCLDKRRSLL